MGGKRTKNTKKKHTYLNGLKVLRRLGKDFLLVTDMHSFWLSHHSRLPTAIVQLATHSILLFPSNHIPQIVSSLSISKIHQLPSGTTKPSGFKSSYNLLLTLCLCPLYLSPSQSRVLQSLPHAEYQAHLISISFLRYCYNINHSTPPCDIFLGRGAGPWPQRCCIFSLPHQPPCASCPVNTQSQGPPSFFRTAISTTGS